MRGEKLIFILTLTLVIMSELHLSAQNNPSDRTFKISESRGSAYDLLNKISTQTGSLFIYDSKAVDNKKRGRISRGEYTIEEAIRIITQDNSLTIKQEGEYILIYKPQQKTAERVYSGEKYVRMEGVVLDRHNGEPVVSATVSPEGGSVGTITNQEGRFRLTLPDSLAKRNILFSSMGYEQRKVSGILLTENDVTIEMMQSVIPLQEVIVRVVDPRSILLDAIRKRESNYHPKPLNITAFYREGIEYKSNLSLSEAVLKLYKSGLSPSFTSDQAK
ncbi:MAG: carboxypeptidase-like regulatory domain-containing protein, partial [Bacteroidales bacterium]|nr:carboxypeptidase-like regulatory domain-containing protein [Bacteroidales bacterium]